MEKVLNLTVFTVIACYVAQMILLVACCSSIGFFKMVFIPFFYMVGTFFAALPLFGLTMRIYEPKNGDNMINILCFYYMLTNISFTVWAFNDHDVIRFLIH